MKPTILVVEDDEVIREVLDQLLVFHGYATAKAAHGGEALERLGALQGPALLVMDLMMPVMNGAELLARLRDRAEWKNLPVVILSAGAVPEELLADPAVRFLRKPLRMNTLLEIIKELEETLAKLPGSGR